MEFNEKLQELRKKRGLTQEELAEQLYVSRTAVSKWETGRGTPSIESLKQIADLFHITLDQLLSAEEIVIIAESENKETIQQFLSCIDGVLNLAALLSLFLPLYKVEKDGIFYSVPLYQLNGWHGTVFWIAPIILMICGIVQIFSVRQWNDKRFKTASVVSFAVHISEIVLLILCGHPYPAVLFFFLFAMKGILILKSPK